MDKIINWRTLVIAIVVMVMILRTPYLFLSPRFWAEEGSVYFSAAFHLAWHEALLAGHQGYYSFFPNFITLIAAHMVALEYAPFVTTFFAFFGQILVIFIVMYRLQSVLNPTQQLLLCIATIFVCNTGEIWLNTITTQFHFGLASFFIILSGHQQISRSWAIFDRVVILVSGLTGLITSFLLPALFIRWIIERNRNVLILKSILISTTFVQIFYILSYGGIKNRVGFSSLYSFLELWGAQFVLWPILGNIPSQFIHNINVLSTGKYFLAL